MFYSWVLHQELQLWRNTVDIYTRNEYLYGKFKVKESIVYSPRKGRPAVFLTRKKAIDFQATMSLSPKKTVRIFSHQSRVSVGSAYATIRKKLYLFLLQGPRCGETVTRRAHTSYTVLLTGFVEHVTPDWEELNNWLWTDEEFFLLYGYVKPQNTRKWWNEFLTREARS